MKKLSARGQWFGFLKPKPSARGQWFGFLNSKPLVCLVLLFSLGIVAAAILKITLVWLYLADSFFLLLAILLFRRKILGVIFLAVLVFFCGMTWLRNYTIIPECHIKKFYYKNGEVYLLRGWVNSAPEYQDNKTSFLFQSEEIATTQEKRICSGEILVIIRGELNLEYGQELILEAQLQRPFGEYLRRKGIFLIARVKTPYFVQWTGQNKGWPIKKQILKFKSWIELKFESSLTPVCAGVIEAMTLGEEKNVPAIVYKDMIRSGTVHILVVSGSNVGIVGFIIVLFFKILRIKRRLRFFFSVPLLLSYCFLTGASNPVVRATVMIIVFLFAYFVKRQSDVYNSCAAAALFILVINPTQIFNIGFQLSFASVLSIASFYSFFKKRLKLELLKFWGSRFFVESCLVSFSAWMGTVGLIAVYFRMVSPITVLANIFIVPLASLITLSGFSLLAAQSLFPCLTLNFVSFNEFLVNLLLSLNSMLLRIPHAYFYF